MKMIFPIWCSVQVRLLTFKACLLVLLLIVSPQVVTKIVGQDKVANLLHEKVYVTTDRDLYISGESILFNVYLFPAAESAERTSRFVYLVLRGEYGKIEHFTLTLNEKKQASGVIYVPDTLSSGAYEIIAFTNYMRNWGEEIFFRKEMAVVNRFDNKLEVFEFEPEKYSVPTYKQTLTDSDSVSADNWDMEIFDSRSSSTSLIRIISPEYTGRRQRVSLSIENNFAKEQKVKAFDLNISVLPVSFHQNHSNDQRFENARQYSGKFPMEDEQVLLTGKLIDKQSGKPVPAARVIMNAPDTVITLAYSITKENGEFSFFLLPYYYDRDIYLSVDPDTFSGDINFVVNDRFQLSRKFRAPERVKLRISPDEIKRYQDIIKVQKIYQLDYFQPGKEGYSDAALRPLLFTKPKLSVLPSLYVELDDFQEIARELISHLSIRRSQANYFARMFCTRSSTFLQGNPVFFIDGIITWDLDPLITLGSKHIKEVQIHNLSWVFGNMLFPGIVGIFTYNEEYRSIGLNRNRAHYFFDSFKIHPIFTPTVHETSSGIDHNTPDLRLLLYWDNDVQLFNGEKTEVEFFTGDLSGDYIINITGVDQDGEFIQERKILKIQ